MELTWLLTWDISANKKEVDEVKIPQLGNWLDMHVEQIAYFFN